MDKFDRDKYIFWAIGIVALGVLTAMGVALYLNENPAPQIEATVQPLERGAGMNIEAEEGRPPIQTIFLDGYRSGYIQACWAIITMVYEVEVSSEFIKLATENDPQVTASELVEQWRDYWLLICVQSAQESIVNGIGDDLYVDWLAAIE